MPELQLGTRNQRGCVRLTTAMLHGGIVSYAPHTTRSTPVFWMGNALVEPNQQRQQRALLQSVHLRTYTLFRGQPGNLLGST